MRKHLVLFALSAITFCFSCKKEVIQTSKGNNRSYTRNPNISPTVQDGILSFTDIDQFNAYCDYLDSTLKGDTLNQTDTLDADEKLALIESELSFISLRSVIKTQWDPLNEIGWSTGEEIPEDHFIHSIITRSVYNADRNLRIGSAINHIYNEDYAILIKDGNIASLNKVKNLPVGFSMDQLLDEFLFDTSVMVYNTGFLTAMNNLSRFLKTTEDTTWDAAFSVHRKVSITPCNNNSKEYSITSFGLQAVGYDDIDIYTGKNLLDLWVDWGDGFIETLYNIPIDISFDHGVGTTVLRWPKNATKHIYSALGIKTVHIKVKRPYHTSWVGEAWNTIDVKDFNCGRWTKKSNGYVSAYNSDGSAYVRACIETHANFWGNPVFEAHSEAYIKNNNGKYKHKKADELVAQLWGDLYTDCNTPRMIATSSWRKNDRTTTAHKGWLDESNSGWSVLYSNHRVVQNGKLASIDLQLIRCQ